MVRKDDNEPASFSAWNITGTYRGLRFLHKYVGFFLLNTERKLN